MNLYPLTFPSVFQKVFPSLLYHKSDNSKKIFLTFDDGPTEIITDWVLQELEKYQAKATFFCIGQKIKRNPDIFQRVIDGGHQIGNHTYQHIKGWKSDIKNYVASAMDTEKMITKYRRSSKLFRPPYGKIKMRQIKSLQENGLKIVMWTSVSGDFSRNLNTDKVINKLSRNTKSGDILVFHDSTKAAENLKAILPDLLKKLSEKGFEFATL